MVGWITTWAAAAFAASGALAQHDFGVPLNQDLKPGEKMSFFVTSVGMGNGANLVGLKGADDHCQKLAATAGFGTATWRAYLSTNGAGRSPAVNARDRIGPGPWYNAMYPVSTSWPVLVN